MEEATRMHRVGVLAYDGMTLLDAAGPIEVLHEADAGRQRYGRGGRRRCGKGDGGDQRREHHRILPLGSPS